MTITSRDNRLVRDVRRLLADSRERRETGRFVLEGARLCSDAAHSGVPLEAVLYTAKAAQQYSALLKELQELAKETAEISPELSHSLGDTVSPQGIFGIGCESGRTMRLDNPAAYATIKAAGRYLALENVQDPANLGTILRTAEAFGLDGLLLSSGCCDLYNPKVLRGSMGGVFRLTCLRTEDMAQTVTRLRPMGLRCYACVPDREALPVQQAGLGAGCVCVIGNEGAGLRPETIEACTASLTVPMAGRAESLNAAMAAGIVLWEMTRG